MLASAVLVQSALIALALGRPDDGIHAIARLVTAVGAAVAVGWSLREPQRRSRAWFGILGALLSFTVWPVLHLASGEPLDPTVITALATIKAATFGVAIWMLGVRPGPTSTAQRLDVAIGAVSTTALWVHYVVVPRRFDADSLADWNTVLLTPLFSVMIWAGLLRLLFAGASRTWSPGADHRRVHFGAVWLATAAYSLTAPVSWHRRANGDLDAAALYDLAPLVALCWAAAALAPTGSPDPSPDARPVWGRTRSAVLAVTVAAPMVPILFSTRALPSARAVAFAGTLVGAALLVLRARLSVAELLDATAALDRQSRTDQLTGLDNRRGLEHQVAVAGPAELGVVYIDLERFKLINDVHGHQAGDAVLREVGRRLGGLTGIRCAARVGGDEFAVLFDRTEPGDDPRIADAVEIALRDPITSGSTRHQVRASVGVSADDVGPDVDHVHRLHHLLRQSDIAETVAKQHPRTGPRFYSRELDDRIVRTASVLDALATPGPHDRLWIAYQSIVHLQRGGVVGAEALARLSTAALGPVGPGEFIPLAETAGLMPRVGLSIVRQSLDELVALIDAVPPGFRLSVNVSTSQLVDHQLVGLIRTVAEREPAILRHLQVEVTESVLVGGDHADALAELASLGVTIAIDDFGSEYASLQYLRIPGVRVLKIDRSFVADLVHDGDCRSIVYRIICLADDLGLDVIAEGVESAAQASILRGLGCHEAQGYLWDRPGAHLAHHVGPRHADVAQG